MQRPRTCLRGRIAGLQLVPKRTGQQPRQHGAASEGYRVPELTAPDRFGGPRQPHQAEGADEHDKGRGPGAGGKRDRYQHPRAREAPQDGCEFAPATFPSPL